MSAAVDATKTYLRAGSYTVTLAVTDKDGGTGANSLNVSVARQSVQAMALPGIINLNDRGQSGVDVALLSGPGFDPASVNPETATIGGVGLDIHGGGDKLSYHYEDLNHDGVADVVLRFGRAALIDAAALKSASTELLLLADLRNGVQIEGRAPIETHVIGKTN